MLQEENWDSVYNTNNINEMFNNFQNTLIRNFDNSFRVITTGKRRKSAIWIANGIKILRNRKRELYLLRRNINNPQVINFYNKYCSILKKVIIEAKKMHIKNQIHNSTNTIKSTWEIIKDFMGSSHSYSPITKINTDNGSTTIHEEIAKAFNEFFVDIAKNLDNKHADINKAIELLTKTNRVEYMEMKPIPFTENELIHTIFTMKTKKSSGYDGISNMILKHCVKAISKPFTYICNFSLTNGIFPDRCKYALVLPVYKRGKN